MKYEFTVSLYFKDKSTAETIYRTLIPETLTTLTDRGDVEVHLEKGTLLKLVIKARDLTMLRALTNSYLRLLDVTIQALKVADYYASST
ncbi:MAG: hypothetical protein J7L38_05840 [Thermoproteales archaeon]|mgnify:CR=1 FL=1|nr:hypothetical protein [Thermoproteales archaeon]